MRAIELEPLSDDPRWTAVLGRDPAWDGRFVYGVHTTLVFCRPSCGARLPRRENVAFYAGPREAEGAGLRACKRCHPAGPAPAARAGAKVAAMCRMLEGDPVPALADLARGAGLGPTQARRLFVAALGVTPRAYAAGVREERARLAVREATSVTAALYDAGYGSSGHFYAGARAALGMAPSRARAGAPGVTIRWSIARASLGEVLVAATGHGVCAVLLGDDGAALEAALRRRFPRASLEAADEALAALVVQVIALVERPRSSAARLPLDVQGTAFQLRVWRALRDIPPGETRSYGELARAIGAPKAVRAVAQACARNPVAVAIPCHRVIARDGDLRGYRWGTARKRALLERERDG